MKQKASLRLASANNRFHTGERITAKSKGRTKKFVAFVETPNGLERIER